MIFRRLISKGLLAVILGLLAACSTAPTAPSADGTPNNDPFEKMNRATYDFNKKFDSAVFEPVAQTYADNVPGFAQAAIGNFFGNLNDVWTSFNNFLQGNFQDGLTDLMRVGVNTTFGFLGLMDVASEASLPKHKNDMGLTFGVWGAPEGPYLVLPFLGPSTTRDTVALPIDFYGDPFSYTRPIYLRNIGDTVRLVDKRAGYLGSVNLMQEAALDEYAFVRDAYLQRIDSLVDARKNFKQRREDDAEMQRQNEQDEKEQKDEKSAKPAAAPETPAPTPETPAAPVVKP